MQLTPQLIFPPFRIDLATERLWHDEQLVRLGPKPFAVLRYLAEHPERLVAADELRQAVWGNTHVGEAVVRVNIREVRAALADNGGTARLIETVPRRGYRLVAPVRRAILDSDLKPEPLGPPADSQPILIGRDQELLQLNRWMAQASTGSCQIVFTVGEAGIGKSTLINTFVEQAAAQGELRVGRGQCVDGQGSGEAYLPLLDLLGWLCNAPDGATAVDLLRRHAPTWLAQMPGLISEAELGILQLKVRGVGQQRMLRELAEAVERMSLKRPMALVLEDLHWSDPSTIAWLDFFARRGRAARVLIIATFRPVASLAADHPLRVMVGELAGRYCHEIALRPLNLSEVADYVGHRIATDSDDRAALEIARAIHEGTEGNPLFVVNVLEALLSDVTGGLQPPLLARLRSLLGSSKQIVPDTIGESITQNFARLNQHEQNLVEIASVAGMEFSAAAIATGADASLAVVEEGCSALADRMSFLERAGDSEWPDGTVAAKFRFRHSLYREVVYRRATTARRTQFHRRIGERLESAYGQNPGEISAELAWHFEQGRDLERALHYHELAAQGGWQQAAMDKVIAHLKAALSIASRLPEGPTRSGHELELNVGLAAALQNGRGWGSPETGRTYRLIETLCQRFDDARQTFRAGMALWGYAVGQGSWKQANARAEANRRLADHIGDSAAAGRAERALGHGLFFLGRFQEARAHLEQAISLNGTALPRQLKSFWYSRNVTSDAATILSWSLEIIGYSDKAEEMMRLALRTVREGADVPDLTSVTCYTALLHWIRGDWPALENWARQSVDAAIDNGVPFIRAIGNVLQGVALAEQGQAESGLALIHEGISACRALGTVAAFSAMLLGLAQACKCAGKIPEALDALDQAFEFVETNGEHAWEAELHRTKGELLLDQRYSTDGATRMKHEKEAEECFLTAMQVARSQAAGKWNLRAATSLCSVWQRQKAQRDLARDLLVNACQGVAGGANSSDLQSARALLSELSALK